jgi:nicotinamidase-related amidase
MKKIILSIVIILILFVATVIGNLIVLEKNDTIISQGTPIEKDSIEKSALLVIDIQVATTGKISNSDKFKNESEGLIQKINSIIDKSTQNNLPVIYIRSEITNWFVNLINDSYAKGSEGANLDNRLKVVSNHIITKDKQDSFCNPKLDSILIANRINKLFIVGLDAAFCVNSTINAAKNRKYQISVISDAVISAADSVKTRMLKEFTNKQIELLTTEEFLQNEKIN